MARYTGPKERIERRIGEKLFLKGERSHSPKSAMTRKPYPPGMHGQRRSGKPSEFSQQLKSKQKVKNIYRLLERQFKAYIKEATNGKQDPYVAILNSLETRLDNVIYRMGFAQSRDQARQLVNHGHILVNARKTDIVSYRVKKGDVITVREGSKRSPYFTTALPQWIKAHEAPEWVGLDKGDMTAKIKGEPTMETSGIRTEDLQSIIEFYSR